MTQETHDPLQEMLEKVVEPLAEAYVETRDAGKLATATGDGLEAIAEAVGIERAGETKLEPAPIDPEEEADREEVIAELPREYREHPLAVNDIGKASWVVSKLHAKQEAIARAKKEAAEFIKSLEKDLERFHKAFMPGLREWAEANRQKQTAKTYAGKLTFTNRPSDWEIDEKNPDLIAYAKKHAPSAVVEKKQDVLSKDDLKKFLAGKEKALLETGELDVPGVRYLEPREEFKVQGIKV